MADFECYRSFVSIYRLRSISAAAKFRFMTQPALTHHVTALEAEVGEVLFQRTSRQTLPTEQGKMLYRQISRAVDQLERITAGFQSQSEHPVIRLGGPREYVYESIMNRVEGLPQHLNISFNETTELVDSLKLGHLDVAIMTTYIDVPGIIFVRLSKETLRLVGPANTELPDGLGESSSNVKESLEHLDWISYSSELPFIRKFWIEAFGECPPLLPRVIIPDIRIIKSMLVQGKGVSVMTDDMIKVELSNGSLKELWVPTNPITNEVWLAYRTIDQINPTIMKFVERCTCTPFST
ncbi:LysR family transcriptional regulator [Paenibacillus sp. YPG26]|uniref:LysR family transcriptional regulator n=1 Tax=Paenibacillus sp. YPG26 TaxID=2878915 RepID=UPI00203FD70E|nr:LysR family transcriptional regulator [Paenibacillus sp. YPG26]USB31867.1 LysR family transcriptional regulator [Paenibacillus sp. YPG26]